MSTGRPSSSPGAQVRVHPSAPRLSRRTGRMGAPAARQPASSDDGAPWREVGPAPSAGGTPSLGAAGDGAEPQPSCCSSPVFEPSAAARLRPAPVRDGRQSSHGAAARSEPTPPPLTVTKQNGTAEPGGHLPSPAAGEAEAVPCAVAAALVKSGASQGVSQPQSVVPTRSRQQPSTPRWATASIQPAGVPLRPPPDPQAQWRQQPPPLRGAAALLCMETPLNTEINAGSGGASAGTERGEEAVSRRMPNAAAALGAAASAAATAGVGAAVSRPDALRTQAAAQNAAAAAYADEALAAAARASDAAGAAVADTVSELSQEAGPREPRLTKAGDGGGGAELQRALRAVSNGSGGTGGSGGAAVDGLLRWAAAFDAKVAAEGRRGQGRGLPGLPAGFCLAEVARFPDGEVNALARAFAAEDPRLSADGLALCGRAGGQLPRAFLLRNVAGIAVGHEPCTRLSPPPFNCPCLPRAAASSAF